MSTLSAVEEILRNTRVPMSVREIVEYAAGALPTKSKTPDTVVARDLALDIKRKGNESLFARSAPGRYTMRALLPDVTETTPMATTALASERAGTLAADRSAHVRADVRPSEQASVQAQDKP